MKKALLFIYVLSGFLGYAQNTTPLINWEKTYGGSNFERIRSIQLADDGGFLLCGTSGSNDGDIVSGNRGNLDFWVVKTNNLGEIIWERSYGGSQSEYLKYVTHDNTNGFLLGGATRSQDGDVRSGNKGNLDFWVVNISEQGLIIWERTYGGSNDDELQSIMSTPDDGYLLAGSTRSNNGDVQSGNDGFSDFWVVKIDAKGAIEWEQTYGGGTSEILNSHSLAKDGGYLLGGIKFNFINSSTVESDFWVVKIDSLGNKKWDYSYGGSKNESLKFVEPTPRGGFLLGGITSSRDGDVRSGNNGIFPTLDYWLVKIDREGSLLWEKTYGGSKYDVLWTIRAVPTGGFLLGGNTESTDKDVLSGNKGMFDSWLIKIDVLGSIEWEKTFGGSESEAIRFIQITKNGKYLLGGNTLSNDGDIASENKGLNEFWLIQLDSLPKPSLDSNLILGVEDVKNNINIYPNPIDNNLLNIKIDNYSRLSFYLSDASGKNILFSTIERGSNQIRLRGVDSGLYFLSLFEGSDKIYHQKIIVR